MNDNLLYEIAISLVPKIGNVHAKNLINSIGDARQVFRESKKNLCLIPRIGPALANNIASGASLKRAEEELKFIARNNISAHFFLNETYPQRLKACADAPVVLFAKGKPDFNNSKFISIVGTRNATEYGRQVIEELITGLAERSYPVTIVSGLAYGIDIHAHKMALKKSIPTIGVVAHGLEMLYPSLHIETAREMVNNEGGIVTDFLSNSLVGKQNFVKRNRIIAGMSDATIVVESAKKGGGLITADIANSYNRDVLAYPGRKGDLYSAGCNFLIKSNRASLIEGLEDLEYLMNWEDENTNPKVVQPKLFNNFSKDEQKIVNILKEHNDCPIDIICIETKLPMSIVSPLLLKLEFSGVVRGLPGKVFRLVQQS
jgi:DNA processing protein